MDDDAYVYAQPLVLGGLSWAKLSAAFTSTVAGNWQPLAMLSLMLDATVYGMDPAGFHATNVGLHALGAVLLYAVLLRLSQAPWLSAVAALAYALHPLRVESVVWISERKDVLSVVFLFSSVLLYLRWCERPRAAYLAAAWALYGLGLLAKSSLVTLPFALLLLDWWPLRRLSAATWRARLVEKLPFAAISLGVAVRSFQTQQASGSMAALPYHGLSSALQRAVVAYVLYLKQCFVPLDLAAFYPVPRAGFPALAVAAAGALLAALSAAAFAQRGRRPYLLVGWLWFLGTLVPMIGLVQVGAQLIADRYTLIPSAGLTAAVVWLGADLGARRLPKAALAAIAAAVLLALSGLTWRQIGVWHDTETLWTHALAAGQDSFRAHNSLGIAELSERRYSEAAAHFAVLPSLEPETVTGYRNYGYALLRLGRDDAALAALKTADTLAPHTLETVRMLAEAAERRGAPAEAEPLWREAAALAPTDAGIALGLATALAAQGRQAEAATAFATAAKLDPGWRQAYFSEAWRRAVSAKDSERDGRQSRFLAERLAAADHSAQVLDLLAAAYAEMQAYDRATATAARAVIAAETDPQAASLLPAFRARLSLYQSGKPYREALQP